MNASLDLLRAALLNVSLSQSIGVNDEECAAKQQRNDNMRFKFDNMRFKFKNSSSDM